MKPFVFSAALIAGGISSLAYLPFHIGPLCAGLIAVSMWMGGIAALFHRSTWSNGVWCLATLPLAGASYGWYITTGFLATCFLLASAASIVSYYSEDNGALALRWSIRFAVALPLWLLGEAMKWGGDKLCLLSEDACDGLRVPRCGETLRRDQVDEEQDEPEPVPAALPATTVQEPPPVMPVVMAAPKPQQPPMPVAAPAPPLAPDPVGIDNQTTNVVAMPPAAPATVSLSALLDPQEADKPIPAKHHQEMAAKMQRSLSAYGFDGADVSASPIVGPTTIIYPVQLPPGSKAKQLGTITEDLAREMGVNSVRVTNEQIAPGWLGIEVPRAEPLKISLRSAIDSPDFQAFCRSAPLPIVCGLTPSNRWVYESLVAHKLVAGATRQGKSVVLQDIIATWHAVLAPEQIQLEIIDAAKRGTEFGVWSGTRLVRRVAANEQSAVQILRDAVKEMERRAELFPTVGVRNIQEYAELRESEMREGGTSLVPMPRLVVIFDECVQLMKSKHYGSDVSRNVWRLAAEGAFAGVHIILATQRPSVQAVDGDTKANFSRWALKVETSGDSRTILGVGGAEKLLGNGDSLIREQGGSGLTRVQACWASIGSLKRLAEATRAPMVAAPASQPPHLAATG